MSRGHKKGGIMNAEAIRRRRGAFTRRLIVLPALVVAMSIAFTGVASASTPFQASVSYTGVRGGGTVPANLFGSCSNGAFFCGTANIAGYGAASWNFYVTGNTNVQTSCDSTYTAVTEFTLAGDGSTLVLNESGYICGPGLNANGYFQEGSKAPDGHVNYPFGHPQYPHGTWTVVTKCPPQLPGAPPCSVPTGQFAGLSGSGTDDLQAAGAHVAGTYSGPLG
jgi:hypothetical protein